MAQKLLNNLDTFGIQRTNINDNFSELYANLAEATTVVSDVGDLPPALSDVITLSEDGMTYIIDGLVDLGNSRLEITANNIRIIGLNASSSVIASTNPNVLITASASLTVDSVVLASFGSGCISANDLSNETLYVTKCTLTGQTTAISVDNFKSLIVRDSAIINCGNGVIVGGDITNASIDTCLFEDVTGNCIDLNGCLSNAWNISNNVAVLTATTTFVNLQANSGNITSGGAGTIAYNKLENTLNGTTSSGYSPFDSRWTVVGNSEIVDSDSINPSGWGFYSDDSSNIISVSSTPIKLEVDSQGSSTNEEYLPNSLLAAGDKLWDSASNKLTPVLLGDSYIVRIQITIDDVQSNPLRVTCLLDIGGGVSPTTVIATDSKTLRGGGYPQDYIFVFPIFSLSTFIANGGQFFFECESGSLDISERSILVERISTGVK